MMDWLYIAINDINSGEMEDIFFTLNCCFFEIFLGDWEKGIIFAG